MTTKPEDHTAAHPDPELWWHRKWRFAKVGGVFSVVSILMGMFIPIWCGPEYADMVRPLATAGMWGGLIPVTIYMGTATAENIANMRRH